MTFIPAHLCFPPSLLRLPSSSHLEPSWWLLWKKIYSFKFDLRASSIVRYPFCSLLCTLAKEVQLFPGLGLYSEIFAMYLQCQSTDRTATIVFYAICLFYALSTVNFVSDFVAHIFEVSNNSICSKNIIFYQLYQCTTKLLYWTCPTRSKRLLWLPRMYFSTHKQLNVSSVLFT